ncbi:hypothetical protein ACFQGT_08865 [Natrialbaceae archaeon GCM10025810]|uniref:DUF7282 domain-containing protein n=1 Tax=Halovalidus salilacus TaxID=3075124 RepID=UPI0036220C70
MSRSDRYAVAFAAIIVLSAAALPLLGTSVGSSGGADAVGTDGSDGGAVRTVASVDEAPTERAMSMAAEGSASADADSVDANVDLVSTEPTTPTDVDTDASASLSSAQEDAVQQGVEQGIDLVQSQGVEVSQEQRAAALEGASQSVVQHQEADVEQVQRATVGAVHGTLVQTQDVEVEQVQAVVGGSTGGALAQHQTASAVQMQSATWGASHGAIAQTQDATVEQTQAAARGGASGAAFEAGDSGIERIGTIQEAAQGSSYGVLEQYQSISAEQRQRVTTDHVEHAAAGASAGTLEGSSQAVLEQEQNIEVEQTQRVTIKQVQKAAVGAAKGALVQEQEVSVEQTQAAARGAGKGCLQQVQTLRVEQTQQVSIAQVQEASFGSAKGAIAQSQEATVEQIQAAAIGASQGVIVQRQEISITQVQYAAVGAAQGALETAVQRQTVEVSQIQAAARGAGHGAAIQTQVVDVTQVQVLASGGANGALVQHQEVSVEQIQYIARGACEETARVVQYQRVSVSQIQILAQETATEATTAALEEGVTDPQELARIAGELAEENVEEVEELEGEARISASDAELRNGTVVIDEASLSEGGFVAVYDSAGPDPQALLGVSSYLEAGDYRDVDVPLETELEENRSIVAVAHHDTDDDGEFDYAESDGMEDEHYVTEGGFAVTDGATLSVAADEEDELDETGANLSVSDQEGDGDNLTVDEANASVDYVVAAEYENGTAESEAFEANESVNDLELALEPPLEENATVDVSVRDDETGEALANESIEYTVLEEDEAEEPEATLSVADQEGDGENLTVDEANATDEYVVSAEYDGESVESDSFEANEPASNLTLALEPPLEENATVNVSVRGVEADEELANETIEYTVVEEDGDEVYEPTATLTVSDQSGDGENLTVDEANASVEYALVVTDGTGSTLAEAGPYDAGESLTDETIALEPPLEDDGTLEVSAVATETGDELANETVAYEVAEPPPEFAVAITGTNAPVDVGEPLEVAAEIQNLGGAGEQEVGLDLDGEPVDAETVSLEAEESAAVELSTETDALEAGEYVATVASENESVETTVTLEEAGEAAFFEVVDGSLTAPDSAQPGEEVTVSATVENAGDLEDQAAVEYAIDGQVVDETTVALEGGESTEVSFTAALPEGDSTHEISTGDDSESVTIQAVEPADGDEEEGAETQGGSPFEEPGGETTPNDSEEETTSDTESEAVPPTEGPDGNESQFAL